MKLRFLLLVIIASFWGCKKPAAETKPRLIVVLSIDQMRGDYWENIIQPAGCTSGFKTLFTEGAVFANAHHKHATTTTAAGHATLATGFYPSHHGIVDNTVYNREAKYSHYSILDTTVNFVGVESCDLNKVSARRLLKPTIGDLIKQEDARSKSYSVALKDRASILMGGHMANRAFWFDAQSTQMVSTNFYEEAFPAWVKEYTGNAVMQEKVANGWNFQNKQLPSYTHTNDSFERECGIFENAWFPHNMSHMIEGRIHGDTVGNYLWNTPFGDEFVLQFAQKIIKEQGLGTDEHTDVLTVSLSAADVIGHQFGPNSKEILDYYGVLDNHIGTLIAQLNQSIGKDNYILVLTGDHGVAALPELLAEQGVDAQRIEGNQYDSDIDSIDLMLQGGFDLSASTIIKKSYQGVEPNFEYLTSQGIDSTIFVDSLMAKLVELHYIEEAYSFFDFQNDLCDKPHINLMRNSFYPDFGYFIKILGKENYLVDMRSCGTTHGSPYVYDTHVPIVFYGKGNTPSLERSKVYTVDIVPTLWNIVYPKKNYSCDGKVLKIK